MRQSMEADSFNNDTAGGPVVVYLEVCDHVVPLVMSPVMQATDFELCTLGSGST